MPTVQNTKVNGRTTSNRVKGMKPGRMGLPTRGTSSTARRMGTASSNGQMAPTIRVNLRRISFKAGGINKYNYLP